MFFKLQCTCSFQIWVKIQTYVELSECTELNGMHQTMANPWLAIHEDWKQDCKWLSYNVYSPFPSWILTIHYCCQSWADTGGMVSKLSIAGLAPLSWYTAICRVPGRTTLTHTSFWRELIVLPGTCVELLTPASPLSLIYHLYVLFVWISYQARFGLKISYPAIVFTTLVIGLLNCGSFIVHILLLGKSKVFTLSVFLPCVCVHVPSAGHTTNTCHWAVCNLEIST